MGNTHSGSILRTGGALDSFVSELGSDVIYEKSLGSARFLKTVKCRHRNGYIVVKIFIKPDPGLTLRTHHRRLKIERESLQDIPNVYGYQTFVETDKAGYIIRQWVASSLYDRISTRPFLSIVEKKWISFQLLTALCDARKRKISHGDVKSENILVTSWNWVYLTDFASYKPTFLPLDNPSDFAFYFDISGRRNCYIAPERFYTAEKNPEISAKKARLKEEGASGRNEGSRKDGKVTEAMDVFSAGCVLAELFLEGASLFTLSQLFKYREGELDIDMHLGVVEDDTVRDLIKQMISLDPANRPTFDALLHSSRGVIFPECFYSSLHNFISSINGLPTPSPFARSPMTNSHSSTVTRTSQAKSNLIADNVNPTDGSIMEGSALPTDSDHRLDRIWTEFETVEPYISIDLGNDTMTEFKVDYTSSFPSSKTIQSILPVELCVPNRSTSLSSNRHTPSEDGPALIILSLVCANLRNCSLPTSKVRALDVLLALSIHLTDEAKLDRLIPYVIDLLHDEAAIVRASALRTLLQVLILVTVITPFNAAIFPEYIMPNLRYMAQDPDDSVRCMFAQCIVPLADTAARYLEMGQALKAHGTFRLANVATQYDESQYEVSYDTGMEDLQGHIQDQLSALLMDKSSVVKRAVLHDISSLCIFFGRQKTNDVLLSHMITYLNDRDWLLRYAFFDSIVDVAACLGGRSLEEYILPLMMQALSDVEETVVAKVLASLTSLCELGLFQKMRIWELMSATLAFLYHPDLWIRQGSAAFIASAAKFLPSTDVWCILYPSLKHFLRCEIHTVDVRTLLSSMKSSIPRQIYDSALDWAMKYDKSQFWRGHRRAPIRSESPKNSITAVRRAGKGTSRTGTPKSEEDEVQLYKLEQLGMSSVEEAKLLALRDYMLKLANAIESFRSRPKEETNVDALKTTGGIELQALGVVPQTVFLGIHPPQSEMSLRFQNERASRGASVPDSPHMSRVPSVDPSLNGTGAPFEDLRRRLATINGSTSSLARDRHVPSASAKRVNPPALTDLPPAFDVRPGSPTESIISTTNSVSLRHRLYIGGTDSQKAAPAIGSIRTNAVGLLEAPSKLRSENSPERSGRSSPISIANTVHGAQGRLLPVQTYDGHDPALGNILEHMYLDSNREGQNDFGPHIHEGPVRRRNSVRQSFSSREGRARGFEASLIAHLGSHSGAINGLAVSPDHLFFVSCSDDKTVKVWDTARLERNITSKPRHTYGQHHARVKCVCMLEGVHCFASAADDGSLHIVRVHVNQSNSLPKYSKVQVIREHRVDRAGEYITAMTHYNADTTSNLLYATNHSIIILLDLKTMRILQSMTNPCQSGTIVSMCLDRKRAWLITATLTGVLTLWDLRFGLQLRSWKVGGSSSNRLVRIKQCVLHPTKGRGRWIMVATEISGSQLDSPDTVLVEIWDIEKVDLVESYVTKDVKGGTYNVFEPGGNVGQDAEMSPATAIASLVRSHQLGETRATEVRQRLRPSFQSMAEKATSSRPSSAISAMVVGIDFGGHGGLPKSEFADLSLDGSIPTRISTGSGFLLAGSEDRLIRLWDLGKFERSTILSGLDEKDKPSFSVSRSATEATSYVETWSERSLSSHNSGRQRSALITQHQQNLLKPHQDCITSVLCIDSPFRGGIITGDRVGVIKVWRVDGLDSAIYS